MAEVATRSNGVRQLPTSPDSTERAVQYLYSLLRRGCFCSLTLKIEDGYITHLHEGRDYLGTTIPRPDKQESSSTSSG